MKPILSSTLARIGVVQNPFSTLNRKRYGVEQAAAADPGVFVEQAQQTQDIVGILERFRDLGVDILVIDGGDGTVREVLSQCPGVFGQDLPLFCILPSGKTNVCAHDTGTAKYKRDVFRRLLELRKTGITPHHIRRRHVLRVEWEDGFHAPVQGMLVGFGGYREATNLAQTHVHSKGLTHNAAVAMTIFRFFCGALFGDNEKGVRAGEPMTIRFDDQPDTSRPRFGAILTTLNSFLLGVWPFWGDNSKAIIWLDIDAPPPRLLRALIAIFTKRTKPWMAAAGYRSGSANELKIETHNPFIIDGETFQPGPTGRLHFTSDMQVDFIAP
ncbi:MAG: diacylglycerol kinase family protein [Robiginitomaculum sp.]|nr:diacylglycerol kinase family protein [Robiginitomaculum sp.]MDQ7077451.1 diacylglycerol kinase family protein [Robiginitomaculum sp.]